MDAPVNSEMSPKRRQMSCRSIIDAMGGADAYLFSPGRSTASRKSARRSKIATVHYRWSLVLDKPHLLTDRQLLNRARIQSTLRGHKPL